MPHAINLAKFHGLGYHMPFGRIYCNYVIKWTLCQTTFNAYIYIHMLALLSVLVGEDG